MEIYSIEIKNMLNIRKKFLFSKETEIGDNNYYFLPIRIEII